MRYSPLPEPIMVTQRHVSGRMAATIFAVVALLILTPSTTDAAIADETVAIAPATQPLTHAQSFTVSDDVVIASPASDTIEVIEPEQTIQYVSGASLAGNGIIWPFSIDSITDAYGERPPPCEGCNTFHGGADFAHNAGQPIPAIADGIVRSVDFPSDFGQRVIIDHIINGQLVSTLYAHMVAGSPTVNTGDIVRSGQVIGYVGETGLAFGEHLHLEILLDGSVRTDPVAWLRNNAG